MTKTVLTMQKQCMKQNIVPRLSVFESARGLMNYSTNRSVVCMAGQGTMGKERSLKSYIIIIHLCFKEFPVCWPANQGQEPLL